MGVQSSGLEVLLSVSNVTESTPAHAGAGGVHWVCPSVSHSGCPNVGLPLMPPPPWSVQQPCVPSAHTHSPRTPQCPHPQDQGGPSPGLCGCLPDVSPLQLSFPICKVRVIITASTHSHVCRSSPQVQGQEVLSDQGLLFSATCHRRTCPRRPLPPLPPHLSQPPRWHN